MGQFTSEPDLHLQWLVMRRLLAAGQLKQDFGIEPDEIARIVVGRSSDRSTPSVELRLLAIGWAKTDLETALILGLVALRNVEAFGIDLGETE